MKSIFILMLSFVGVSLFAQSSTFQFGLQMQAGMSGLVYQNNANANYEKQVQESAALRFSPGVMVLGRYNVSPTFLIQAGLGYTLSGYRVKEFDLYFSTPDLPEGMYVGTAEGMVHYHDLALSLQAKAKLAKQFYLVGGVTNLLNLAREQTIVIHYDIGETTKVKQNMPTQGRDFRQLNLRGDLGFGYNFGKSGFYLEPLFGYSFFSVFEEGNGKYGQYSAVLNLGFVF